MLLKWEALLDRLEVRSEGEGGDPDSTVTVLRGVASILQRILPAEIN